LRYLAIWSDQVTIVAGASFRLCEIILESVVDDELKWDAARLVIQIGFRDRKKNIYYKLEKSPYTTFQNKPVWLAFLEYHLANDPQNHDSIADAYLPYMMIPSHMT
jgi:hypothetical protein